MTLRGAVQGCGLRPALARLAFKQGWSGSVRNTTDGVELIVKGLLPSDDDLRVLIDQRVPRGVAIEVSPCEEEKCPSNDSFQIVESTASGPLSVPLPQDTAICNECLKETRDPTNRRYRYSFTTCARCGPRYSMLLSMPFDRARTTMQAFDMCPECEQEYHDPMDRRFHAQTIACPHCGPLLWTSNGRELLHIRSREALDSAAAFLRSGGIVAMRGIGGYQLLVDATSSRAVARLRERKRRPAKPFAVLCRTLADALIFAEMNAEEEKQLCSPANPIVLLRQRRPGPLAPEVNPGLCDIGLMLPTAALHDVLLERVGIPLVCTSGNVDGEPLAHRVEDAEHRLYHLADVFLNHDRDIHRSIDDSVVRVIAGRPVTIRAARGIAPLPLKLAQPASDDDAVEMFLACGGQQKGALAMSNGAQALLGPHIGDCDTVPAQERWSEHVRELCDSLTGARTLRSEPMIVCDPHPGYFPTQWAARESRSSKTVGHHHAHVITGMLEHGWLDREVLGVAWDGTGLGPDGTIWGGEFLRATATGFHRVAHFRPFRLPGGEAAMKDLGRLGVALMSQLEEMPLDAIANVLLIDEGEVRRIQQAMSTSFSPTTTSCGRLFDVAALLILNQSSAEYEGHAAMCLEAACDLSESEAYSFLIQDEQPLQIDWRPVMERLLEDRKNQVSRNAIAMRFHRGMAQCLIEVARRFPELPVVLGGGVFQNRVLVELITELWPTDGQPLGLPGTIPPNDGGLAAGQLAVAMAQIRGQVMQSSNLADEDLV